MHTEDGEDTIRAIEHEGQKGSASRIAHRGQFQRERTQFWWVDELEQAAVREGRCGYRVSTFRGSIMQMFTVTKLAPPRTPMNM